MIGATIGAVIVSAIAFATDWKMGVACVIFYVIYQQVENYVLYPRVMSRSVDVPGAVTVIAALVGLRCWRRRRAAGHPDRRRDPADHPRGVHQRQDAR
jgi:predicted PurR-regulated permease PerM